MQSSPSPEIMKYRDADCTLFRVPPLDFSQGGAGKLIEDAILDAWNRGYNAQGALDALLRNRELNSKLAAQIAPNLEFQRGRALESIQAKKAAALSQYASEREQQIKGLEATAGAEAEALRQKLAAHDAATLSRITSYSAAQQRLDELRARVKDRMEGLGGESAYSTLSQIRDAVLDDTYKPSEAEEKAPEAEPEKPKIEEPEASKLEKVVKNEEKQAKSEKKRLSRVWNAVNVFRYFRRKSQSHGESE